MKNEDLKSIIRLLIVVVFIVLAVKFFIYLLPLIAIVALVYFAYDFYKKTRDKAVEKVNNSTGKNSGKKKHHVQEAEIVREKNSD